MKEREYKIYTLSDPRDMQLRYVGITTKKLKYRLHQHIKKAENSKYTYHSLMWIRKLLKENITPVIELVEICNEENWKETEIYWIAQFKTWGFKLTNSVEGGRGNLNPSNETRKRMSKAQLDLPIEIKKKRMAAARKANVGRKHSTETMLKLIEANSISVDQYTLDGIFVKTYSSITIAAKILNTSISTISACCLGHRRSAGDYRWAQTGKSLVYNKKKNAIKGYYKRLVFQYDLNGNFINKHNSIKEAKNYNNLSTTSGIIACCQEKIRYSKGFIWTYEGKVPKIYIKEENNRKKIKTKQFTKEGIFIKEFKSIVDASKNTNIYATSIGACCNGKRKSAGGFKWRYAA